MSLCGTRYSRHYVICLAFDEAVGVCVMLQEKETKKSKKNEYQGDSNLGSYQKSEWSNYEHPR